MLLAHGGRIDAAGATTFGVMMIVLALTLSAISISLRIRAGQRPYSAGAIAALPFGVLAAWCFGFAVACRWGANPAQSWRVAMLGTPLSIWVGLALLRRAGLSSRRGESSRALDSEVE